MRKHRIHAASDYIGAHLGELQAAFTWYAPSRGACLREILFASVNSSAAARFARPYLAQADVWCCCRRCVRFQRGGGLLYAAADYRGLGSAYQVILF